MTHAGGRDPGRLPAWQARRIFDRQIAPNLLRGASSREFPQAVLIAGQPGAGKTALARELAERFVGSGGAVRIDVDMFRPFHPEFERLLRTAGDRAATARTEADARVWFEMALASAVEQRLNVIAEHGLTPATLEQLAGARYQAGVAFLAVPAAASRLANLARYHIGRSRAGGGRYVVPEMHDRRYRQLPVVAAAADADPRVSSAEVYDRARQSVYHNERGPDGNWHDPPRTQAAIDAERQRPWRRAESEAFRGLSLRLARVLPPELAAQVRAARREAAPLLYPATRRLRRSPDQGRHPKAKH